MDHSYEQIYRNGKPQSQSTSHRLPVKARPESVETLMEKTFKDQRTSFPENKQDS